MKTTYIPPHLQETQRPNFQQTSFQSGPAQLERRSSSVNRMPMSDGERRINLL